jgi:hypothetical protein
MPKVGTLERRNPLPPGSYWIDVFGLNIPKFDNWLKAFSGLGVHVDATQHFESSSLPSVRTWYKFTYTAPFEGAPIVWDTTFGFPTVADATIKSSEDTVSRPDLPIDPLDELSNWTNALEQKLGGSLGALAGIVPFALLGGAAYLGFTLLSPLLAARKVSRRGTKHKK